MFNRLAVAVVLALAATPISFVQAQDFNPNKAPAFTADYIQRNLKARDAAQTLLAARIGQKVSVQTLMASPYPKANHFCGLALTSAGGIYIFTGDGPNTLVRIADVAPVQNTQNGVAVARNKIVNECGGIALAHTIVEYGYPAPTSHLSPQLP